MNHCHGGGRWHTKDLIAQGGKNCHMNACLSHLNLQFAPGFLVKSFVRFNELRIFSLFSIKFHTKKKKLTDSNASLLCNAANGKKLIRIWCTFSLSLPLGLLQTENKKKITSIFFVLKTKRKFSEIENYWHAAYKKETYIF